MNSFKTYQNYTGAFLLALYAFVSAPVQLWHQHARVVARMENSHHQHCHHDHTAFTDDSTLTDESCTICTHQFAPHAADSFVPLLPAVSSYSEKNPAFVRSLPAGYFVYISNKGPPFC